MLLKRSKSAVDSLKSVFNVFKRKLLFGLLSSGHFATIATWRDDFSSLLSQEKISSRLLKIGRL